MGDYITIADVRAEGFEDPPHTDARITSLLPRVARFVERATGRFFEPRQWDDTTPLELDSDGGITLDVPYPIISISRVRILSRGLGFPSNTDLATSAYVAYNRHAQAKSQIVGQDDDRDDPRIELVVQVAERVAGFVSEAGGRWPIGPRMVQLSGWFGYTDFQGVNLTTFPRGDTPPDIKHLCVALVARELDLLRKASARSRGRNRYRVEQVKTKDQSYRLAELPQRGFRTGDPTLDGIIVDFMGPSGLVTV